MMRQAANKMDKAVALLLAEDNYIKRWQIENALDAQQITSGLLVHALVRLGYLEEKRLLGFVAKVFQLSTIKDGLIRNAPAKVVRLFPPDLAVSWMALAIGFKKGVLVVASAFPLDEKTIKKISFLSSTDVINVLATEKALLEGFQRFFGITPISKITQKPIYEKPSEKQASFGGMPLDPTTEESTNVFAKPTIENVESEEERKHRFEASLRDALSEFTPEKEENLSEILEAVKDDSGALPDEEFTQKEKARRIFGEIDREADEDGALGRNPDAVNVPRPSLTDDETSPTEDETAMETKEGSEASDDDSSNAEQKSEQESMQSSAEDDAVIPMSPTEEADTALQIEDDETTHYEKKFQPLLEALDDKLIDAEKRDDIIIESVSWLETFFKGALFMAVKKDLAVGFYAKDARNRAGKAKNFELSLNLESIIRTVALTKDPFIGVAPDDPSISSILVYFNGEREDFSIMLPIVMKEKTIGVLTGVGLKEEDAISKRPAFWHEVQAIISATFETVILSKKMGV